MTLRVPKQLIPLDLPQERPLARSSQAGREAAERGQSVPLQAGCVRKLRDCMDARRPWTGGAQAAQGWILDQTIPSMVRVLLLVVMPGAPSSTLAPSSKARSL